MNFTLKLKQLISGFVYFLLLLYVPRRRPNNTVSHKNVCVIFMGALGDFLTFCSAAQALFTNGYTVQLVCRSEIGIEEIARETGLFSTIISVSSLYRDRLQNVKKLRNIRCYTAFSAPFGRHILEDVYLLAIQSCVMIVTDTFQDVTSKFLKEYVDKRADQVITLKETWEWARYGEFLRKTGLSNDKLSFFHFSRTSTLRNADRIVVFPGASRAEKCWPVQRYASVLLRLVEEKGCTVQILGSMSDKRYADELEQRLPKKFVQNLCGKTSLLDTKQYILQSRMVIANDSGGAHMGISCDIPTVIIAGAWQFGRFFPNEAIPDKFVVVYAGGKENSCQLCGQSIPHCMSGRKAAPCIAAVSEDQVEQAVKRLYDMK